MLLNLLTVFAAVSLLSDAAVVPRWSSNTYDVNSGTPAPVHDPAPVALSIEFFAFPGYVQDVGLTAGCIANLDEVTGAPTRVRIGGTTQDRATYDPTLTSPAKYVIETPGGAPLNLTYGPSFFDLASGLSGPTTIGLNRRLNNLSNSIDAAEQAVSVMENLYAIELGNEPDRESPLPISPVPSTDPSIVYVAKDPIANNQTWTPATDAASQVYWQESVGTALHQTSIIQGGVFLTPPKYSVAEFGPLEQSSGALQYVKSYSDHSYPQSACGGQSTNLPALQNHSGIVEYVGKFEAEVVAAGELGRPLFFGETNSATCGGGGISPTFGAALWIVDYVIQSVHLGYQRLYFHQGTIGNCAYCWWGQNSTFAPYYGAYFAAEALSGVSTISQLDDSTSPIAVYALHTDTTLSRTVIVNTEYLNTTDRSYTNVTLTGLPSSCGQVKAKRLTAPLSTSLQETTFAGQKFDNSTCSKDGEVQYEYSIVEDGCVILQVGASEALLVYF